MYLEGQTKVVVESEWHLVTVLCLVLLPYSYLGTLEQLSPLHLTFDVPLRKFWFKELVQAQQ